MFCYALPFVAIVVGFVSVLIQDSVGWLGLVRQDVGSHSFFGVVYLSGTEPG